jgi:hypothetical protein
MARKLKHLLPYIGQKIHYWTLIEDSFIKKLTHPYIKAQCICKKIKYISYYGLMSNKSKSCGCKRNPSLDGINRWKKTNTIHPCAKKEGIAALNLVYRRYLKTAKDKNLEFSINKEIFINLIKQNCFYCNSEPIGGPKDKRLHSNTKCHGLDRLNSKNGYILENVVPCCTSCNYMKRDSSLEEFVNKINKIYRNVNEKKS